jgi:hypothetical protein
MYPRPSPFKQTLSPNDSLAAFAVEPRAKPKQLSAPERGALLTKARRADTRRTSMRGPTRRDCNLRNRNTTVPDRLLIDGYALR